MMRGPGISAREFRTMVATVFEALRDSDAIILDLLHRASASRKADGSEVTQADKSAERLLRKRLARAWPADEIVGEEFGGCVARSGRCWLLDPIDGTASFVLGMPMFGTLAALLIDGEPVFGCIHLPALRETTYAATGLGCWLTREWGRPKRVHVGPPRSLADAKVGLTVFKEQHLARRPHARGVNELPRRVGRFRMVGDCVQYPLLCRGALDAAVDPAMKPWDIGALVPCILEAGGAVSDLDGETSRLIERTSLVAASSASLCREIRNQVRAGARARK
jgi:histidinol-phosphatase